MAYINGQNVLFALFGKSADYRVEFSKDDFSQVGSEQKYVLTIPKTVHGLDNPYVVKMVVNTTDTVETEAFYTEVVYQSKSFADGSIKIYITTDLTQFTQYGGKIYLRGE